MCDALLRDAIEAVRLEPSPTSHYRSRMVYGVLTRAAIAADNLGMSNVKRVAAAVAEWVEEHSAMPRGFWRELTVRASRSGALQLKLILQVSGDAGACTLAFDPIWTAELTAFESFVRAAVDGSAVSACFQLASSAARPDKAAGCVPLFGDTRLIEEHPPSCTYLIGPETLSQVNPATASVMVRRLSWWLGVAPHVPEPPASSAASLLPAAAAAATAAATSAATAATSIVRSSAHALVLGRDVNLFVGLLANWLQAAERPPTALDAVTHCSNAHADLLANIGRLRSGAPRATADAAATAASAASADIRARLCPKGAATVSLLSTLPIAGATEGGSFALVSAGRRGLGCAMCAALRSLPFQLLVYVGCCDATAVNDLRDLLSGDDGFAVADAARFDHFPKTAFTGSALLLLRRPRALVLPVGPAGSGKTTLCTAMLATLPVGTLTIVERDVLFGACRAGGAGIGAAKRHAHAAACAQLVAANGRVAVYDSANSSLEARAGWTARLRASRVVVVSFEPGAGAPGAPDVIDVTTSAVLSARHRAVLLERTRGRTAHPTFPCEAGQQAACVDATMASMQWPDGRSEAIAHGRVVTLLHCDPLGHGDECAQDDVGAQDGAEAHNGAYDQDTACAQDGAYAHDGASAHESTCAPDGAKAQDGPEPSASLEPCLAPPRAPVSLDPVLFQLFRALYWLEGQPGIEWDVAWRRPPPCSTSPSA